VAELIVLMRCGLQMMTELHAGLASVMTSAAANDAKQGCADASVVTVECNMLHPAAPGHMACQHLRQRSARPHQSLMHSGTSLLSLSSVRLTSPPQRLQAPHSDWRTCSRASPALV